jgi:hypothetical protein
MSFFYGELYKPVNNVIKGGYPEGQKFTITTKANPNLVRTLRR